MARTIPPPHRDETMMARKSLQLNAERHGIELDADMIEFINAEAQVKAQMFAEIRWLRNMLHQN